jgi:predicted RNA-binding Zn-ribbon protein involved in translation (DUF1610 family)
MDIDSPKKIKSYWQEKPSKAYWEFLCPVCRSSRRLPVRPRPTAFHYFQLVLTSVVFTVLAWKWFTWKGFVSFFPLWMVFEILYRGRARIALDCPQCGFDPSLHLLDAKRAREEMEKYWRKKFEEKGIPFPEKAQSTVATGEEVTKKGSLTEVIRES